MKKRLIIFLAFLSTTLCYGQTYNREKVCRTDTIHVDHVNIKMGERIKYDAFGCTQVSKIGIRFNLGFSSFSYYDGTKKWIGNHNAGVIGLALAYGKFNLGVDFKLTTVSPQSKLVFNGDTVTQNAKLNPIKDDFYASYSIDLKNNFSLEPHLGLTKNMFFIINEKELNKSFTIPNVYGANTGITLNKYFKLKDFQFITFFLSYTYGFTDFKKINADLGSGYSEWSFGLAYKVFGKRRFFEKVN